MHLSAVDGTAMKMFEQFVKITHKYQYCVIAKLKTKITHHKPPPHKAQQTRRGSIQQEMGDAFCCCNI